MRTIFATFFLLVGVPAMAQQQAALDPSTAIQERQFDAVVCRSVESADAVAIRSQMTREFGSLQESDCALVALPDDFRSPIEIANEDADIRGSTPAPDGSRTLIYTLPAGHERNKEGVPIFLVLAP